MGQSERTTGQPIPAKWGFARQLENNTAEQFGGIRSNTEKMHLSSEFQLIDYTSVEFAHERKLVIGRVRQGEAR